jgi:CheY-specific phosphatase CheX
MVENKTNNTKKERITMENKSIDVIIRGEVYKGGQSLVHLIEDVAFSIKYPVMEGKLSNDDKEIIKDFLKEINEIINSNREQIIKDYDIEIDEKGNPI